LGRRKEKDVAFFLKNKTHGGQKTGAGSDGMRELVICKGEKGGEKRT